MKLDDPRLPPKKTKQEIADHLQEGVDKLNERYGGAYGVELQVEYLTDMIRLLLSVLGYMLRILKED